MKITNVVCPEDKYSIKCPHEMTPEGIVVHNTANDASAMAEISYMLGNNNKVSFHAAVDDERIVTGIPFNRNSWNAGDGGNGVGNRKRIAIEICYSKSGGERFENAEKLAAKYIAYLLKEYGWGVDRVSKHQDYSGKYCPHRTLDMGWDRFLNMIKAELGEETNNTTNNNNGLPNLSGYNGNSIVDGLNSVGYDSSYASRKALAEKLGIANYTGTAEQNLKMIELLKGNSSAPNTQYLSNPNYKGTSIVSALNEIGVDSSYANRKQIAIRNGITNYTGTAEQNTELLNKLKNGTLIK